MTLSGGGEAIDPLGGDREWFENMASCFIPKRDTLFALMICFTALRCHNIDVIIGRSAFEPHRPPAMSGWDRDPAAELKPGDRLTFQGIYTVPAHGQIGQLRQFDRRQGWSQVNLSDLIPVENGALVAVTGQIVTVERPLTGIARVHRTLCLKPSDVQVISDTGPAQERARCAYARIRPRLQDQISLPGSKLVLAEQPRWQVDWLKGEQALIVSARSFDLMYAAEAQFLFSLEDEQLQKIYFIEWFKGE
jgi:hypothetical protein